ncbi:hypothetical protein FRB91_002804 [Serendipita sp. 411]|nr:hypothetical protein FRC19_010397 [Serendipita sp. 401]KAG8844150.1 hypothetical protein FRB91_002804 [Serendipita sp. 411]
MSTTALFGLLFGCVWAILPVLQSFKKEDPWYTKSSIRDNIQQLHLTSTATRNELDPSHLVYFKVFLFSIPVTGILLFFFFGLGPEALARYHAWIKDLSSFFKLPSLCKFLWKRALSLGWLNGGVQLVDPEYFGPLVSNDITLDPPQFILPEFPERSHFQASPAEQATNLPYHPTPLRTTQSDVCPSIPSSEEWRTYHKEPPIVVVHPPTHRSPTFSQFRTSLDRPSITSERWKIHRMDPIPPWFSSRTLTSSSPDRLCFNVNSPSTPTRSDLWSRSYTTTDYFWSSSIGRSSCYDEAPPPYRPPVKRGVISKDPLSALF